MGRKDRVLSKLDSKGLLRLAESVSGIFVNGRTSRHQLVRIVKGSFSVQEIENAISKSVVPNGKLAAFLLASIILYSSFMVISAVAVSGSKLVAAPAPIIEWSTAFNFGSTCTICSTQQTSDDGYILAGNFGSTIIVNDSSISESHCLLLKTNSKGKAQWSKAYMDDYRCWASCVRQTNDAGYIMAGDQYRGGAWLIRTDLNGNIEWSKTYDITEYQHYGLDHYTVQQTLDGGFIIAGKMVIKTDSSGNVEWERKYFTDIASPPKFVQQTSDGGYIIAGDGAMSFWLVRLAGPTQPSLGSTYTTICAIATLALVVSVVFVGVKEQRRQEVQRMSRPKLD